MRPPRIKITVTNKREFKGKIYSAQRRLQNRTSVHRELYPWFAERWIYNFQAQGGLYQRWAPLEPRTKENRAKMGIGPGPKLDRTGGDYSLIGMNDGVGGMLFEQVADQIDNRVVWEEDITEWSFTNDPPHYPLSHHFGYPNPWPIAKDVPARLIWDINRQDAARVKEYFLRYITSVLQYYN